MYVFFFEHAVMVRCMVQRFTAKFAKSDNPVLHRVCNVKQTVSRKKWQEECMGH
jgi:hypothetical protein